jgi:predicted transcriptional regulator
MLYYLVMDKQTISFRLDAHKVAALDSLAEALDRDRSYLLNEAVRAYLEIQHWQTEHIAVSLQQADVGQLVSHAEVKKAAGRWRRR